MRQRLLLGPVLIAVLLAVGAGDQWLEGAAIPEALRGAFFGRITFPPGVLIFLFCAAVSFLSARELAAIFVANSIRASKRIMTGAAVMGLLVSAIVPATIPATVAVAIVSSAAVGVLLASLVFHSRHRSVEGAVAAAGGSLLAFVYLGLMFGFVLAIRREHEVWVLLWIILVTKSCDIGAYFTGKSMGRHKLIPWLSPGKTWEGLIGGLVLAAVAGAIGQWLLGNRLHDATVPVWAGAVAGVLFGATGQLGDLIASLFKRDAGIKDSSRVLPGFGGVLDVLDSPLLVAPVAYWWLRSIPVAIAQLAPAGLH
jgi:phosphatidate cytidylyltransferase